MKRIIPAGLLIFVLGLLILSSSATSKKTWSSTDPGYKTQWTKVDSLERKGLYRMALTEVGLIFDMATQEQNHNQVIKSVLYELKYNSYLEEDDYVLGIYRLDELV